MKYLVGTDIEEVVRFQKILNRKPRILSGLFFLEEIEVAKKSTHTAQTLAGYWCAKEAVVKAFGPVFALDIRQVEIIKDPAGFPKVCIHNSDIETISYTLSISISHTRNYATATALLTIIE
jgi:holo-[acyl-carrier protein] synthase